ncbi:hypothetical protein [Pseudoneobacillus sp. C159]
MNKHSNISFNQNKTKLYNFFEYQNRKPFFKNQMHITVGNPINETYFLVKNVVFRDKQILVLQREKGSNTVILVEAKIVNGKLAYISKLQDDFFGDVSQMLIGNI